MTNKSALYLHMITHTQYTRMYIYIILDFFDPEDLNLVDDICKPVM